MLTQKLAWKTKEELKQNEEQKGAKKVMGCIVIFMTVLKLPWAENLGPTTQLCLECIWSRRSEFIHSDEAGSQRKNCIRCRLESSSPPQAGENGRSPEHRPLQRCRLNSKRWDESDRIKSRLRTAGERFISPRRTSGSPPTGLDGIKCNTSFFKCHRVCITKKLLKSAAASLQMPWIRSYISQTWLFSPFSV